MKEMKDGVYNNQDFKRFSKSISQKLESLGEVTLSSELTDWNKDVFTTSSEFLGELRLILQRIKKLGLLDEISMKDIQECITVINKAFAI